MEYKVIFETKEFFYWPGLIPFIFAVVGLIVLLNGRRMRVKRSQYILPAAFTLISVLMSVVLLLGYFDSKAKIYNNYIIGKYMVAEGLDDRFQPLPVSEHDTESFCINNVYFYYPDSTGWGYSISKKDGGCITGDGQRVRIRYIQYRDRNVILKLEVMPDDLSPH